MQKQKDLEGQALQIREDVVRMLSMAGSGHLGGSLSSADILTALYGAVMRYDTEKPESDSRDQFVLSIGHVAPVYYAALARSGFFPVEELGGLRTLGSRLQGHPSVLHGLPGVDVATGSLGQGLSVGVGMALANRLQGKSSRRTYVLLGDGELQEGQVWEAAMSAGHYRLAQLYAIVDRNRLQIDGATRHIMGLEPLRQKWESFGWEIRVVNGHVLEQLEDALRKPSDAGKPVAILANTLMGAGIPSIENQHQWHGKVPTPDAVESLIEELRDEHYGRTARLESLLIELEKGGQDGKTA